MRGTGWGRPRTTFWAWPTMVYCVFGIGGLLACFLSVILQVPWLTMAAPFGTLVSAAAFHIDRRRYRPRFLEAGMDLCHSCGYCRRGLPESSPCPECGVAYDREKVWSLLVYYGIWPTEADATSQ